MGLTEGRNQLTLGTGQTKVEAGMHHVCKRWWWQLVVATLVVLGAADRALAWVPENGYETDGIFDITLTARYLGNADASDWLVNDAPGPGQGHIDVDVYYPSSLRSNGA